MINYVLILLVYQEKFVITPFLLSRLHLSLKKSTYKILINCKAAITQHYVDWHIEMKIQFQCTLRFLRRSNSKLIGQRMSFFKSFEGLNYWTSIYPPFNIMLYHAILQLDYVDYLNMRIANHMSSYQIQIYYYYKKWQEVLFLFSE